MRHLTGTRSTRPPAGCLTVQQCVCVRERVCVRESVCERERESVSVFATQCRTPEHDIKLPMVSPHGSITPATIKLAVNAHDVLSEIS